ncbi:hypothetical protein PINS_up021515 [Pythium insidiosum]|nr:hypothetical protein PINS_up021515 [Pythium insidiosum]
MVLVHVKRGDKNEFLYETTVEASNDALIRELCAVNNARLRLQALADALPSLAKFGVPSRPTSRASTSTRKLTEVLTSVAEDAKQYLNSKLQIDLKVCMKQDVLQEKLMNIPRRVMMAFPHGATGL